MGQNAEQRRAVISDEAARWVVRLADDACPAKERSAFALWRDANVEHELAYERAAAAWHRLDRLKSLRPGEGAPDADLLAPLYQQAAVYEHAWWKKVAAAVAGISILGGALSYSIGLSSDPAYATGIGERRVVILEDGSHVELNTNSEIRVHYRQSGREVELVRGEAVFDVAADKRPFVVRTADARFIAGRSALSVRIHPQGSAVAVERGTIEASPGDTAAVHIAAGQEALIVENVKAVVQPIDRDEFVRRLAWRQGAVSLDGQPLAEAVAEFNRYNSQQIVIADPSIAHYRLGGYFRTGDIPGFIKALRTTFPIAAKTTRGGAVELSRSPA